METCTDIAAELRLESFKAWTALAGMVVMGVMSIGFAIEARRKIRRLRRQLESQRPTLDPRPSRSNTE